MALNLSIPVSIKSLPKDIETNPKRARAWIESLPLSKPVESARAVAVALEAINRGKLSVDDRLDIVEAYRGVTNSLLDELESIYGYAPLPLGERQLEAYTLARTLLSESAYTYKMYLVEKSGKLIVFNARKTMPLAALRTMRLLRALMWQSYKTYHPVPPGTWREAHALLLFADENGFAHDAIDVDDKATIAGLHIDMMMLSLADPYRLMNREVDQVSALLAEYRGTVDIVSSAAGLNPQRLFVVALDSDLAPSVLVQGARPPEGNVLRMVNPTRLVDRLVSRQQTAGNTDNVNKNSGATRSSTQNIDNLIDRLITLWGDPPKRQFRRSSASSAVALCAGIKAISYFAELVEAIDPESDAAAIREGRTLPIINIPQDAVSQAVGVEAWQVLNQSANGLRLHRDTKGRIGVTVGEVVGVRFIGGRTWNVGVVRWLTVLEGNEMEFGVELISPKVASVTIEATIANNHKPLSALAISSIAQTADSHTILTPPDTFYDLREYEINDHGKLTTVRAIELLERTARFDLFRYQVS
jgi:cyclic-di-GMP-binding protein